MKRRGFFKAVAGLAATKAAVKTVKAEPEGMTTSGWAWQRIPASECKRFEYMVFSQSKTGYTAVKGSF